MNPVSLEFNHVPSAARYMALALRPKRLAGNEIEPPRIRAVWRDFVPAAYLPERSGFVHPIGLQAAGLRLMMAILTCPSFPLPIWRLLQVRNRIVQHRSCAPSERLQVSAAVAAMRTVEKGIEFDLEVKFTSAQAPLLESVNTFYARGGFSAAGPVEIPAIPQPEPPHHASASWSLPRRGAFAYGRLTGDYNGVHWSNRYAKLLGFSSAFAHPHRVLTEILNRVPGFSASAPLQIQAWYKGPVYYGEEVELATAAEAGGTTFALRLRNDPRPAILGSVSL